MLDHTLNSLGQPIGLPLPGWTPPPRPSADVLQGHYCRLEKLDPACHAAELHAANSLDTTGSQWTYLPFEPFTSLEAYRAWADDFSARSDPRFYAIIDLATGRAAGVASYLRIDPAVGSIEVGHINFSLLLQRSRAATEAMYRMMEHAFALGYRRYEWKCDALNAPSRAAAARYGFTFEGIFRQATIVKGRNRDTAWYSIIDREWPAIREAFGQWLDPGNFDAEGKQRVRLSDLIAGVRSE